MQHLKCFNLIRNNGESVMDYVTRLQQLANKSNFGASCGKMLRDRLVCGVNDETTRQELLAQG